jgi:ABC-type cobalamin/Fe3+-siderophores transport system ATPase subunit
MYCLRHLAYENSRAQLRRALDDHRPGHMVFLIGPSGAGKTTMRTSVMQEMFGDPAHWGRGKIPAIEQFAFLVNQSYFSSKDFVRELLSELHDPSLEWLLRDSSIPAAKLSQIQSQLKITHDFWDDLRPLKGTEGEMWGAFRRSLVARGCKYVSIDQVTALLKNHRDTSPADHTLHLMALAESSGIMFIMTGIHEAARLWNVHSELRRRVIVVWAPPYSDRRPADKVPFLRVLRSLESKFRFSQRDMLLRMSSDLLAATGGIFGQLFELLLRADRCSQNEGSSRILKRHVEAAYLSDKDLAAMWRDVEAFEDVMCAGDVSQRASLVRSRWSLPSSDRT